MKKIILLSLALLAFQFVVQAQRSSGLYGWFFLSPKAGIGTGIVTNQHVFTDGNVDPRFFSFSHAVGAQAGVSLMNFLELAYEYGFQSPSARYTIQYSDVTYTKHYRFTQQGQAFLIKVLGSVNYMEMGWGTVNNQSYTISNTIDENTSASRPAIVDVPDIFKGRYNKFILGAGITPYQSGLIEVEMGARLTYGLGNLTNTVAPIADNFYNHNYSESRDSRLINIYFQVQLKYFFGFYGKAICGGRGIMFFQKPKNFRLM